MQAISRPLEPPLFFVINGGSGRQNVDTARRAIASAMRLAARTHEIFVIEDAGSLKTTIKKAIEATEAHNGAVVAVGGDGTINAVATAAHEAGCLFGAIPQGTFNYFGRTHGIPEDIVAALDDLLHGKPVPVQVGVVNDRIFLVNASVGLYPELLEDREKFKQRYGRSRLVALWSAVVTAFRHHRYLDMALEQGGERVKLRATTLFVGNNRLQLEQVGMPQAESVKQGQLAAIAVKPVGTLAMLWLAARGALGRLADAENIMAFSFRSLSVVPLGLLRRMHRAAQPRRPARTKKARKPSIKVATDGEIIRLHPPLEFSVASKLLLLIKRTQAPGPEGHVDTPLPDDGSALSSAAARAATEGGTP